MSMAAAKLTGPLFLIGLLGLWEALTKYGRLRLAHARGQAVLACGAEGGDDIE